MHTTGLADETIGRLYEGDRLARGLRDARSRTLAIYSHLDLASWRVPQIAIVNPPVWELSHIAWFQERWCLRWDRGALRKPSLLPGADELFDSSAVPHATRWSLPFPPLRTLLDYMNATLEATLEALEATPEEKRYFFALSLLHEDMHGEALLMTLQTLGLPAPPIGRDPPPSQAFARRDIAFPAGAFEQGTRHEERDFVFDNEKWAHEVSVAAFRMAHRPVTQGEFAAFAEEAGTIPAHWRREGGAWLARHFDAWRPIDPHAPMVHVSLHDALAYCRWAGRRLPTEAEWEYAARNAGAAQRFPWGDERREDAAGLDYRHRGPSSELADPLPSRSGLEQMLGGVWEWTSSAFLPYLGFRADPYEQYSEPWFASHYVLRGGSFATRSRLVHNRFRNFYTPERADIFAGFRTCAVE